MSSSKVVESPWASSAAEVLAGLGTSAQVGLSSEEAAARLEAYGRNELAKEDATPLWQLVLAQFDDVLVKVLLLAAVVSFGLAFVEGEGFEAFVEPAVILLILILNAVVGVWQESNAERALEALKEMQSESAKTLRDGLLLPYLPASDLVPGDVVTLSAGDRVPADARLVDSFTATVRAQQASLTGESVDVQKRGDVVTAFEDVEIQAKDNMLFAGTAVASGSCACVVTATGMRTEMGKIHEAISEAAQEVDDTPLKKKLDEFGVLLTQLIGIICVLVWLINYSHFLKVEFAPAFKVTFSFAKCTYYFKIAVALAVAAIPEGLPTVITTCLALGTRKMVKQNAIVRKLPSVETLGCTTVICSDKTGTLTTNQMSCVKLTYFSQPSSNAPSTVALDGTSYDPSDGGKTDDGNVSSSSSSNKGGGGTSSGTDDSPREQKPVGVTTRSARKKKQQQASALAAAASATSSESSSSPKKNLASLFEAIGDVCALCNEADLQIDEHSERVVAIGAPTEAALLPLVEKLFTEKVDTESPDFPTTETTKRRGAYERLAILEFDRDRKSMSALVRDRQDDVSLFVKGAPESLFERTTSVLYANGEIGPFDEQKWVDAAADMAGDALRCLALAVKTDGLGDLRNYGRSKEAHALLEDPSTYRDVESGLTLLGLVGLLDPPRPEVPAAIRACRNAGIRVVVITGDNKLTAEAICRNIGVVDQGDEARHSITGRDFAALSKDDQIAFLFPHQTNGSANNNHHRDLSGRVFSRAEPTHKQDIVRLLKERGEVAAMTGDGVNDAPALKLADIGIAMGIAGTEVAKEASDMVLADDNFSSIVAAVAEGRSIYNNMKAFIRYMISSNVGEVASIFLTAALGMPEGLVPVQLLWVNLVTDGPPATALGFNPADPDNMIKPPRRSDDALLTPWIIFRYFVVGAYVGIATVGVFAVWFTRTEFLGIDLSGDGHSVVTFRQLTNWDECATWSNFEPALSYTVAGGGVVSFDEPCEFFTKGKVKASTLSLSVLVAIEMFNALNALSEDVSLLVQPPWVNPYLLLAMAVSFGLHFVILSVPFLADTFAIVPLTLNEWLLVILFSAMVVVIDEVLKFVGRTFVTAKNIVVVDDDASTPDGKQTKSKNGRAPSGSAGKKQRSRRQQQANNSNKKYN